MLVSTHLDRSPGLDEPEETEEELELLDGAGVASSTKSGVKDMEKSLAGLMS